MITRKTVRLSKSANEKFNQIKSTLNSRNQMDNISLYSDNDLFHLFIELYHSHLFGQSIFDNQVEKFNNQLALTLNTILTQTEKNLADYISVAIRENQITMEVMFVILNAMNITASNPQEISQKMINNSWIYETVSETVNEKNKFIKEESEEW